MSKRLIGKVTWFNQGLKFGFIESNNIKDCLVHCDSIISTNNYKTLYDDQIVEFEVREGDKGLTAINVILIDTPKSEKEKILLDLKTRIEDTEITLDGLKRLKDSLLIF